jgi:hypothetical protein
LSGIEDGLGGWSHMLGAVLAWERGCSFPNKGGWAGALSPVSPHPYSRGTALMNDMLFSEGKISQEGDS